MEGRWRQVDLHLIKSNWDSHDSRLPLEFECQFVSPFTLSKSPDRFHRLAGWSVGLKTPSPSSASSPWSPSRSHESSVQILTENPIQGFNHSRTTKRAKVRARFVQLDGTLWLRAFPSRSSTFRDRWENIFRPKWVSPGRNRRHKRISWWYSPVEILTTDLVTWSRRFLRRLIVVLESYLSSSWLPYPFTAPISRSTFFLLAFVDFFLWMKPVNVVVVKFACVYFHPSSISSSCGLIELLRSRDLIHLLSLSEISHR